MSGGRSLVPDASYEDEPHFVGGTSALLVFLVIIAMVSLKGRGRDR